MDVRCVHHDIVHNKETGCPQAKTNPVPGCGASAKMENKTTIADYEKAEEGRFSLEEDEVEVKGPVAVEKNQHPTRRFREW